MPVPAVDLPELDATESKVFNALSIGISVLGLVGIVLANVTESWAVVALVLLPILVGVAAFHAWVARRHQMASRALFAATMRKVFSRQPR